MTILEHAKASISEITTATADGTVTLREAWKILGYVVAAAKETIDALDNRAAGFADVVEVSEAAFDALIAPVDFTAVPNWIEAYVKTAIRGQIRTVVSALYDHMEAAA